MFLASLTFLTGLSISAVAIYYSVIGLTAIFAAAVIPIIIMGTVLEVAKLVSAWWLKANWERAPILLKSYMFIAVLVLMFITSMGIFGFLSKAHIEQTAMSTEQVAQIETLNEKMARSEAKIQRWQTEISRLLKGEDVRVDNLVDNEQQELDKIYNRIKDEKATLRSAADKKIEQQNQRLQQAAERKEADIKTAEQRFKNSLAGGTQYDEAVERAKRTELGVASSAQREIRTVNRALDQDLKRVDDKYAGAIADIQKRIADLRKQASTKTVDIDKRIEELEGNVGKEQLVVDSAREEKFAFEKTYRQLEAEVGPVKYIAEFIYGEEADKNLLEKAVTWVIITIIFVFDPLAVLLLLASQMSFGWAREQKQEEPKVEYKLEELVEKIPEPEEPKVDPYDVKHTPETHPYLNAGFNQPEGWPGDPVVAPNYEKDDGALSDDQLDQIKQGVKENEKQNEMEEVEHTSEENQDPEEVEVNGIRAKKVGDYYEVRDKKMSGPVFAQQYPDIAKQFALQTSSRESRSGFGTRFPSDAIKGDVYLRVDVMPNKLFKYNGNKWMEIDKSTTDSYTYDEQYIHYLIEKLASGEYDIDQLSPSEQELVAEQLKKQNDQT